jgi:hypothetical protein
MHLQQRIKIFISPAVGFEQLGVIYHAPAAANLVVSGFFTVQILDSDRCKADVAIYKIHIFFYVFSCSSKFFFNHYNPYFYNGTHYKQKYSMIRY